MMIIVIYYFIPFIYNILRYLRHRIVVELRVELQKTVKIVPLPVPTVKLTPGFIDTDLLADGNNYPMILPLKPSARKIYKALTRRRRKAIIDWKYWFLVQFWKGIPNWIWERLPWKL